MKPDADPTQDSSAREPGAASPPFADLVQDSRAFGAGTPLPDPARSRLLDSVAPRPSPAPEMPLPGQRIGDYEIVEFVGAGGFSLVFRARHGVTGAEVALKLPRNTEFLAHLKREALMAARLEDPRVVGITEVRLDHDPPYVVMPFVAGTPIVIPPEAVEPAGIVTAFVQLREIAAVVGSLHAAGIVHGDLKPGNLRRDLDGRVHVLDLGMARHQVAARQLTSLRASVVSVTGERIGGTLEYMAPEVLAGSPPGKGADVYALGVLLHQLLCGRAPAFGVSPAELNPFLPPGTAEFLRRMLERDPARRIGDARELDEDLREFIATELRCLAGSHGHVRRLVFRTRMNVLLRGLRALSVAVLFIGGVAALSAYWPELGAPRRMEARSVGRVAFDETLYYYGRFLLYASAYLLLWLALVLGVTTLNAWLFRIPERLYKHRKGHPLWNFMMQ